MDFNVKSFPTRLRTIRLVELIVCVVVSFVLGLIVMEWIPIVYEYDDLLSIIIVFFILLFFMWWLRGTYGMEEQIKEVFKIKHQKEIFYVMILNLLFAFIVMFILSGIDIFLSFIDPTWISGFDIDTVDIDSNALLFSIIATVFCAPVMEELVFRGVIFNRLKIRIGILPAMIISSFIFAIGHEFGGMTSAFLFGVCMCILYLKTDNIFIPMSVHFLNNLIATILETTGIDLAMAQLPWLIPFFLVSVIATLLLLIYIFEEIKKIRKEIS